MFVFSSVDGAVVTYGRAVEEHGFLGQLGVMVSSDLGGCGSLCTNQAPRPMPTGLHY